MQEMHEEETHSILVPENDGITHINIYSKGKTPIGQMLSNFYKYPVETRHGEFKSVEGYWHWLGVNDCPNKHVLKIAYGIYAKRYGSSLKETYGARTEPDFETCILEAIWRKFRRNTDLLDERWWYLPFEHYYVFGGKVVDQREKYRWMIDGITKMRNILVERMMNGGSAYVQKEANCN